MRVQVAEYNLMIQLNFVEQSTMYVSKGAAFSDAQPNCWILNQLCREGIRPLFNYCEGVRGFLRTLRYLCRSRKITGIGKIVLHTRMRS